MPEILSLRFIFLLITRALEITTVDFTGGFEVPSGSCTRAETVLQTAA
jgi:hypothetical protein